MSESDTTVYDIRIGTPEDHERMLAYAKQISLRVDEIMEAARREGVRGLPSLVCTALVHIAAELLARAPAEDETLATQMMVTYLVTHQKNARQFYVTKAREMAAREARKN